MLYVRIELWPKGLKEKARLLGEAFIANDGKALDHGVGHYNAKLMKSPEYATGSAGSCKHTVTCSADHVWKKGRIVNFPRLRLGPWDLLYRLLKSAVGDRNEG